MLSMVAVMCQRLLQPSLKLLFTIAFCVVSAIPGLNMESPPPRKLFKSFSDLRRITLAPSAT